MEDNKDKLNSAKGRESYDSEIGNSLIHFFNKNISPYPTEVGGVKFDLIPVEKQKDIMVNVARLHAQQEYDRIMQLVKVLQEQAQQIKRRLDVTDMVHKAKYDFQIYHGNHYWLIFDTKDDCSRLTLMGPNDWMNSKPDHYDYICKVKWLGDYTWLEVNDE